MSTALVEQGDLKTVVEKNPQLFDVNENGDADFNKLTLYVMTEKVKGEKSFWFPYLNIAPKEFTMLDWSSKEVDAIPDVYLVKQLREYKAAVTKEGAYFLSLNKRLPSSSLDGRYVEDAIKDDSKPPKLS